MENTNVDPFSFIEDIGTRNAVAGMSRIVIGAAIAVAVAKGWLPEAQSSAWAAWVTDWIGKAIELGGFAYVLWVSWRHSHHIEKEIRVASALPAGTPRQEIADVAKQVDPKDFGLPLPPL